MGKRPTIVGAAVGVLLMLLLGVTETVRAEQELITLRPNGTAFWTGPMIGRAGVASGGLAPLGAADARLCPPDLLDGLPATAECITYEIRVIGGGDRLRVALDHPFNRDGFALTLTDSEGHVVDHDSGQILPLPVTDSAGSTWQFNAEVFALDPAHDSVWKATVVAYDVVNSAFRMRAKLEATLPPRPPGRLLPNLQSAPPFDIGFGPCTMSEQDSWGATRCLRFAQGPMNLGRGALTLFFTDTGMPGESADGETTLVGTQYQRIDHGDGSYEDVPAGQFEFHVAHGHYHHRQTGSYELFRVADPATGELAKAGNGPKHGFCMGDYMVAEWEKFTNEPRRREADYFDGPICLTPVANRMGISAGWGDVYGRTLDGNAVDFNSNGPGLYVIRAAVNPTGDIIEERYDDNQAYALVEVCDDNTSVVVHRRGIGADPWHELRVVDDHRPLTPDSPKTEPPPGPGTCPA